MKKLLFLAAILALGATSFSLNYTDYYPEFDSPSVNGIADTLGWHDITDTGREVDQINRFIKEGPNARDCDFMIVLLTIHEPIRIQAETNFLYGEGVVGGKLEFGDVEFTVSGTKDATAEFTFLGDVFDLMKVVTLEYQGNVESKADDGLKNETILINHIDLGPAGHGQGPQDVSIEMDLYFDLEEAGHKGGIVLAKAEYK